MTRILAHSPHFYPQPRPATLGIILHGTRGGADPSVEFEATLNWFANPKSEVSAHIVIDLDGTIAECVPLDYPAYHAGAAINNRYLGVELVQPHLGDAITDAQHRALAGWCREMAAKYGFPLTAETLLEHKDTPQGRAAGKSDIGDPFSVARLLDEIEATSTPEPDTGSLVQVGEDTMTDDEKAALAEHLNLIEGVLDVLGVVQELFPRPTDATTGEPSLTFAAQATERLNAVRAILREHGLLD